MDTWTPCPLLLCLEVKRMGQHVHPLLMESNPVTFPWISLGGFKFQVQWVIDNAGG